MVFSSTVEARYFLSTANCAAAFGFCLHPHRASQDRSGRSGGAVGVGIDPFAIRDDFTAILAGVRFVRRLVHAFDVSCPPVRDQQGPNRLGVGHGIHFSLASAPIPVLRLEIPSIQSLCWDRPRGFREPGWRRRTVAYPSREPQSVFLSSLGFYELGCSRRFGLAGIRCALLRETSHPGPARLV